MSEAMRLLFVHAEHRIKGGAETAMILQREALQRAGIECRLLLVRRIGNSAEFEIRNEMEGEAIIGPIAAIEAMIRDYCGSDGQAVIHIHELFEPEVIRRCIAAAPTVRSMHGPAMICPGASKFFANSNRICTIPVGPHCLVHAYTQRCASRSPGKLSKAYTETRFETDEASQGYRRIFVMSDYMRREAVLAGYPEARLRLMPYFIPEREAETAPEQAPRRLLFVGRFIRHKGIDLMLRALVPVFERLPDVALDVVGEGLDYPELQAARALMESRGLAQRVTWHGWKTAGEIQAMYDRCTLTIFPSVYAEAFGIVGIESQMVGRPVVAFDVGGVSDWLRDGENGLLLEPGDVEGMTAAVTALLENPELYARLAAGAAQSVRERFIAPAVVPQMIAEYRACLAESAAR